MIDQSCIGLSVTQDFTYDWRDLILYHLSVGAGAEELEYVYEKDLKMLPAFGVIPCFATFGTDPHFDAPYLPTKLLEGLRPEGTLHMDHKLTIHRLPDPSGASLHMDKKISNIYDRGAEKGAKLMVDVTVSDEKGPVFTNEIGYYNRYAGGFGGDQPPKSSVVIPDRAADMTISERYQDNANLLYRLTGDTHRLHVDPEIAKKSGFDRCIIHGLCSFGYACRMLIHALIPHEPERLKTLEVQFRNVAFPGEAFRLEIWKTGEKEAVFCTISERTGKSILDRGKVTWE